MMSFTKICGENKEIAEMESNYASLETFVEITECLMSHIEDVALIKESELERIKQDYTVKNIQCG